MHAVVHSGKLTEVDTEVGKLVLKWRDHPDGEPEEFTFDFEPDVELEMEWKYLMGQKVDVLTIDDEVVRVTMLDDQAE